MILRPCTAEDIRRIELQPEQAVHDPRFLLPDDLTDEQIQGLVARTIEHEGRPIACAGLRLIWPGVAETWAFFSEEILEHAQILTKQSLRGFKRAEKKFGLRRVQATVAEDHAIAHRWICRLGFRPEGRMPNYGPYGETHWMYGRVS